MCHLFPQSVSHCRTLRDSGSFRGSVRLEFVSDMLVFYSALFEQSGQAPVGRFFCDAAAMQLRFGCDAKRKSFCGIIGAMTLCWRGGSLHLWLAAELEGNSCRYSFGAPRNILRQAGTLRGTQARLGTDTFACRILGQSCLPNGFGEAFAKRWMPHAIEFSYGFETIQFQSAFLRWVLLLQFCLFFTMI